MAGDDRDDDSPLWNHRTKYDLNSKIMLIAIISLSVVVVLVTFLQVYARCMLRRQSRRGAALRQLGIITSANFHTSESPRTGLDSSVIASLPLFVFKQNSEHGNEMGSIECSVCLSILEDGEMARTLPNCKHIFHAECIDQWFNTHSTCPICRTEAEPRLVPEPREGVAGGGARIPPTAPPLEQANSALVTSMEGSSDGGIQSSSAKINGSSSRLSSFRWILTRDRSSRRVHHGQDDVVGDLERVI